MPKLGNTSCCFYCLALHRSLNYNLFTFFIAIDMFNCYAQLNIFLKFAEYEAYQIQQQNIHHG